MNKQDLTPKDIAVMPLSIIIDAAKKIVATYLKMAEVNYVEQSQ